MYYAGAAWTHICLLSFTLCTTRNLRSALIPHQICAVVLRGPFADIYEHRNRLDDPLRETLARDLDSTALHLWRDPFPDGRNGLQLGLLG